MRREQGQSIRARAEAEERAERHGMIKLDAHAPGGEPGRIEKDPWVEDAEM
jgi:hypothetical protein